MMIKINLLPVRQVKKRELGRQVLVLMGVVLVLTGVVNYIWYSSRDSVRTDQARRIEETQRRIAELEKVIGEVKNINKRKKEVEDKLKVLNDLRRQRSGPVKMMDALATATPKKVWLREFTELNNQVKITGIAVSHDDVADFMKGLENIVWTPRGLSRVIERKRDGNYKVEMLAQDGAIDEFGHNDVSNFFTGVELRAAHSIDATVGQVTEKRVDFEIGLTANYAVGG